MISLQPRPPLLQPLPQERGEPPLAQQSDRDELRTPPFENVMDRHLIKAISTTIERITTNISITRILVFHVQPTGFELNIKIDSTGCGVLDPLKTGGS